MKKIVLAVFISTFVFIFGCSQKELNDLRSENQQLKTKIQGLEQEITTLKETADYHYQRGINLFSSGKYFEAKTEFITVIEKYPDCPLVNSATQQLERARAELEKIDKITKAKANITTAINDADFNKAKQELKKIKEIINQDVYKEYNSLIYENANKPLLTSINKIISDSGKFLSKRVKFICTFSGYVDRSRKSLTAYNGPGTGGSSIEVFYEGSNAEEYFTNRDPGYNNVYEVVGKTNVYYNSLTLYIMAEKIEKR